MDALVCMGIVGCNKLSTWRPEGALRTHNSFSARVRDVWDGCKRGPGAAGAELAQVLASGAQTVALQEWNAARCSFNGPVPTPLFAPRLVREAAAFQAQHLNSSYLAVQLRFGAYYCEHKGVARARQVAERIIAKAMSLTAPGHLRLFVAADIYGNQNEDVALALAIRHHLGMHSTELRELTRMINEVEHATKHKLQQLHFLRWRAPLGTADVHTEGAIMDFLICVNATALVTSNLGGFRRHLHTVRQHTWPIDAQWQCSATDCWTGPPERNGFVLLTALDIPRKGKKKK